MRFPTLLVIIALVLGACAAETTVSPTTTPEPTTTTTTTTLSATTPASVATTTTIAGAEIDVEIRDGEVTGPDRFEFERDEGVSVTVVSDTAYELHVHGYDLRYDLEPEVPFTIEFIADVPGIFEVETHPDHLVVFEIEVGG